MLGEWACPALGHAGKAWGVRASFHRDDLIFLAVADSPEDGANQFVHVLDGSHEWASDGGVAVYNPTQFEKQVVTTSVTSGSITGGTFKLAIDFTGTLVPALAHNQIAFGNNTTNTGIGMGGIATAPGQLNGPGHHCPITV